MHVLVILFWFVYGFVLGSLLMKALRERAWAWDYWVGQPAHMNPKGEDRAVMFVKKLTRIPFTRWEAHLHKMVVADTWDCFHTHPAFAVRIILWGGYNEEIHHECTAGYYTTMGEWRPGYVGIIRPDFCHRIHRMSRKTSWSLWLRGPIEYAVELKGDGWPGAKAITDHFTKGD